jgi:SAM-dependent methyltransferase
MIPALKRSFREEWLDRPDADPVELEVNFKDLSRINRCWGGNHACLAALAPLLDAWPRDRNLRLLDVGCGGGDLLAAFARRCRRRGIRPCLVGVDRSPAILEIARRSVASYPEIHFVQADALELPFRVDSFDFVVCSLMMHHLPGGRAVEFLRGLHALARGGAVVSDLRRGRWEYLVTFLFTHLFTRGRATRLDGPLSVLRSFTLSEARQVAQEAGWKTTLVTRSFPLRLMMKDRELRR